MAETDPPTGAAPAPLYAQDPTTRFGARAQSYGRARTGYPPGALDFVLEGLGHPSTLTVLDVGAGTGISSRLLAERGGQVWALEPNAQMREAMAPHPRVVGLEGQGEAIPLGPHQVDLACCFQAFHWLEPARALPELWRVLRPGGRLAVVGSRRERADPFTAALSALIDRASGHHRAADRLGFEAPLREGGWFTHLEQAAFPHAEPLDGARLERLLRSASYLPAGGEAGRALLDEAQTLLGRFADGAGQVRLHLRVEAYRLRPAATPPAAAG
jgi:SAM-dependent methyltransferase